MKVVIAGGSGQVGTILARHLRSRGDEVTVVSRGRQGAPWDSLGDTLEASDVCINLAGRSVNCRYHAENRREILASRVQTTLAIHSTLARLRRPPRLWVNASTATIYRHALDRPMDEMSGELGGNEVGAPYTWKFSVDVAKAWERAFFGTKTRGTRQVAIRSAMTFSPDRGGVFDVLLQLVRFGLGGTQGTGTQFVSWIHETDFCRAVDLIVQREDLSGAINLASPNPLSNREFMRELREAWGTRVGIPVPTPLLEMGALLRRTESELVLKSRRVVPRVLLDAGFEFTYPEWTAAARDLVARWRAMRRR
ncbi:MAG TPA: TIGR01777 family oxidoreductase [Bryobacteraceae bacterium]|nr:TIGR01777 family oxidoreductase [Bryobacteraceae bacterium]